MIPTAYQLLHDVATATESCDKLSKVEKSCVSCLPQLVKVDNALADVKYFLLTDSLTDSLLFSKLY